MDKFLDVKMRRAGVTEGVHQWEEKCDKELLKANIRDFTKKQLEVMKQVIMRVKTNTTGNVDLNMQIGGDEVKTRELSGQYF